MYLQSFSKGQKMPCYNFKNSDGVVVDLNDAGIIIKVFMQSPTEREKRQFMEGAPLKIKLVSLKNVIFFLLKFGSEHWCDAPYSVHLSKNLTNLQNPVDQTMGYAVTTMLIDSKSETLVNLRLYSMPHRESEILYKMIKEQNQKPFPGIQKYNNEINNIYLKYSTEDLLKFAY